jgi:hypothetical protein
MQTMLRHVRVSGTWCHCRICLVDSVIMDASPIENRLRKSFTINKEKTTLQDHFMANKVVKMCINANFLFEVYFLGETQREAGSLW